MSVPGHTLPGVSTAATTPPTDDRPAAPRTPALSPSRAADFKRCPLLYRFRAIDRIPEVPSRAQLRGSVVHAALEALFALPAAERRPGPAGELVAPAWQRLLEEAPDLADVIGPGERDRFLTEARALVARYFALEDPTGFTPQACELRVETELDDGLRLRGFVDRIDISPQGLVRVVDYKTGRAPRETGEAAALFQLKFYALMVLCTRGVVPARLRLLYLADGQVLDYTPDGDELRRFEGTVRALWAAVRTATDARDFRPNPGPLCRWCDHRVRCPAFGGTAPPYPGRPDEPAGAARPEEETSE